MQALYLADGLLKGQFGTGLLAKRNLMILNRILGADRVHVHALADRNSEPGSDIGFPNRTTVLRTENVRYPLTLNCLLGYYNLNPFVERRILDDWRRNEYALAFFDNSMYGRLAAAFRKIRPGARIVTSFQDVKRNLAGQWLREAGWRQYPSHVAMLRNERLAVRHSDALVVLNAREADQLHLHYGRHADLELPITIADRFDASAEAHARSLRSEDDSGIRLLFVGSSYFPNVRGIAWFIREVLPGVPAARLAIVGNGMDSAAELRGLSDRVEIVGPVDDLAPWYYGCDAVVAPVFEGAGMKVKTAEALMHGRKVFGSPEALVGYEQCPTDIGIRCEAAPEWIAALRAEASGSRRSEASVAGVRRAFLAGYTDQSACDRLTPLLARLLPESGLGVDACTRGAAA